jgi:hypothetical protein
MTTEEQSVKLGKIITRAWEDNAFKQRLLADATSIFAEEGIAVPGGIQVKVVENTDTVFYFVLPQQPGPRTLSPNEIITIAGGQSGGHCSWIYSSDGRGVSWQG